MHRCCLVNYASCLSWYSDLQRGKKKKKYGKENRNRNRIIPVSMMPIGPFFPGGSFSLSVLVDFGVYALMENKEKIKSKSEKKCQPYEFLLTQLLQPLE